MGGGRTLIVSTCTRVLAAQTPSALAGIQPTNPELTMAASYADRRRRDSAPEGRRTTFHGYLDSLFIPSESFSYESHVA